MSSTPSSFQRLRRGAGRSSLVAGVLAANVTLAGVAVAAIPDTSTGQISGCISPSGVLRVIDAQTGGECRSPEKPLVWNSRGPAGPAGPAGATGPVGPAGTGGGSSQVASFTQPDLVEPYGVTGPDSTTTLVHSDTFTLSTPGFVTTYLHGRHTLEASATCGPYGGNGSSLYVTIDSPDPIPSDGSVQPGIFMMAGAPAGNLSVNYTYPAQYLSAGPHTLQYFYQAQSCDTPESGNVAFSDLHVGIVKSSS